MLVGADCVLFIVCRVSCAVRFSLFVVCCLFVRYVLSVVRCLLFVVWLVGGCPSFVVCSLPSVVGRLRFVVCCLLCAVCWLLVIARCSLCVVCCRLLCVVRCVWCVVCCLLLALKCF